MDAKLADARSKFEKLGDRYKIADHIEITKEIIEDVTCYWIYEKHKRSSEKIILYLHGGCFALGSIDSHEALVSHLAVETDSTILFIEYSLAPEHPYPTAVNEVVKIYKYLSHVMKIADISFMGDSAGPGLITSAISALNHQRDTESIDRCIMISPWIDLRNSNPSISGNKDVDLILAKEGLDLFATLYAGDHTVSEVNPMETFFGMFPPTLIMVGSNEILLDDAKMIHARIAAKQPLTTFTVYEKQAHVWLMDDIHSEASKKAIEEIKWFLTSDQLGSGYPPKAC